MEEEIKRELETKSKSKKIDIKALEESRRTKAMESTTRQQQDFRHLLIATPTRQDSRKSRSSEEKEKRMSRSRQSSTESSVKLVKVERKGKSGPILSNATELTGSWDYIPSAPTSTVQLIPEDEDSQSVDDVFTPGNREEFDDPHHDSHLQEGAWNNPQPLHEQQDFENGFNDDDDNLDDMSASPPLLNLHVPISSNTNDGDGFSRKPFHQEFDFETNF